LIVDRFHSTAPDFDEARRRIVMASGATLAALGSSLEVRLERGAIEYFPVCPFQLPEGEGRAFLLEQRLASRAHKNISYDPNTGKAAGFARSSAAQSERLRILLASFAQQATSWLARTLPRYARTWRLDRVSFRPEEEATRRLRLKARNDLLHVDAFPSRPTNGHRILRLFANVNLGEPRVWATSEPFGKLLERFGTQVGLPTAQRHTTRSCFAFTTSSRPTTSFRSTVRNDSGPLRRGQPGWFSPTLPVTPPCAGGLH
jgi:hypothetical protein